MKGTIKDKERTAIKIRRPRTTWDRTKTYNRGLKQRSVAHINSLERHRGLQAERCGIHLNRIYATTTWGKGKWSLTWISRIWKPKPWQRAARRLITAIGSGSREDCEGGDGWVEIYSSGKYSIRFRVRFQDCVNLLYGYSFLFLIAFLPIFL